MIPIPVIEGRGYVFNVETLKLMREKYHLPGVLTGVLPQFPQQNAFNGLPLQLMPEELKYLLDTGDFFIFDARTAHKTLGYFSGVDLDATPVRIPARSQLKDEESILNSLPSVSYTPPTRERYQIFKYLVERGYFLMPGLRFGSQFMAYPGDLMRYHSHYNVLGFGWNEEFKLLDVISAGRLATSVKKCWVVGANEPDTDEMQVFSIEWAGFG